MQIDIAQFHAAFFDEAAEHLADMESVLLELENGAGDPELLNRIFRAAHSIKGSSGTFGFKHVARFTHGLENLLDRLRDGSLAVSEALVELLLRSTDMVASLIAAARSDLPPDAGLDGLLAELEAQAAGTSPAAVDSPKLSVPPPARVREYIVSVTPGTDLLRHRAEPLLMIRELASMGEVLEASVATARIPALADLEPDRSYFAWNIRLRSERAPADLEEVFLFVQDECVVVIVEHVDPAVLAGVAEADDAPANASASVLEGANGSGPVIAKTTAAGAESSARPKSSGTESNSIRVSVEKVDEMINLVGELVISQSMLSQTISGLSEERQSLLTEALATLERSTRDLQERVMSVRMVPVASVFRRFPRLVRDLATSLKKQVEVEIIGEETELDKQMVEQIGDPLTHLVRNAVDHGIEGPQDRIATGKSPEGHLRLVAFHEGGNVIIDVVEDGRGLDAEKIRNKAISLGLADPNENLTEEQIQGLIFLPGFSTAATISDVSGRGVGMDVVKRNIEALNGSVHVASEQGKGTRFRIKLPLTMAILDGLSVRVGSDVFIVPLLSVVESFRPKANEVQTVAGRCEVVVVRGEHVPLLRLGELFHVPGSESDPKRGLVMILETQNQKFGLLVDELIGQLQVVMKSLESNYRKVEGLSGATILGDGRVALIVDIPGLSRLARQKRDVRSISTVDCDAQAVAS